MAQAFDILDRLVTGCAQRAWRLARLLMGNDADADDVVQQAFIVAARKQSSIPQDAWPWFAKVIGLEARDFLKRAARRQSRAQEYAMARQGQFIVRDSAARDQLARELRDALAELPRPEREALAFTKLGGLTLAESARLLNVPVSTLDSRVNKGLERLRSRLRCDDAAMLGCLAVLPFDPPPMGYAASAQRWVGAARAAALAPALVGGTAMLKFGAGLAAGIVLLLVAIFAFKLPERLAATRVNDPEIAAEEAPPRGNPRPVNEAPKAAADSSDTPVKDTPPPVEPAPTPKDAPRETPPAAVNAEVEATLQGVCLEGEYDASSRVMSWTDRPIPGAWVWLERAEVGRSHLSYDRTEDEVRGYGVLAEWKAWCAKFMAYARARGVDTGDKHAMLKFYADVEERITVFLRNSVVTRADNQGRWSFTGVPAGVQLVVRMFHPDYVTTSPWPQFHGPACVKWTDLDPRAANIKWGLTNDIGLESRTSVTALGGVPEIQLCAQPSCWLEGKVMSAAGVPVPGASVVVAASIGQHQRSRLHVETDGQGRFLMGPLCPNETLVLTTKDNVHKVTQREFKLNGDRLQQVDITLETGCVVRGSLRLQPSDRDRRILYFIKEAAGAETHHGVNAAKSAVETSLEFRWTHLDATRRYRISVSDGFFVIAQGEWFDFKQSSEVVLDLAEIVPARVTVGLSGADFTGEKDFHEVYAVPVANCRGSWRETLQSIFERHDDRAQWRLTRIQPQLVLPVRLPGEYRFMTIGGGLPDNSSKFDLTDEQLARIRVSDVYRVAGGEAFNIQPRDKAPYARVFGRVENLPKGGHWAYAQLLDVPEDLLANRRIPEFFEGDRFEFDSAFWPGRYRVFIQAPQGGKILAEHTAELAAGDRLKLELRALGD